MKQITWMHPSYRDLVIEELAKDRDLRRVILKTANIDDIQLAFSVAGGGDGSRSLPLLVDDESWEIVSLRCAELATDLTAWDLSSLIRSLSYVYQNSNSPKIKQRVLEIIKGVCENLLAKWNEHKIPISVLELRVYCNATLLINPLPPIPNLVPTWEYYSKSAKGSLTASNVEEWVDLVWLISQNEPRFLKQIKFPESYLAFTQDLMGKLENDINDDFEDLPVDELEDTGDRYSKFAESMRTLATIVDPLSEKLDDLASLFSDKEEAIREQVRAIRENEPDNEFDIIKPKPIDELNIQTLFRDL